MTSGVRIDRGNRRAIRKSDRGYLSQKRIPWGEFETFRPGEEKVHCQDRKIPKWRDSNDKDMSDFERDSFGEDLQDQEAGNEPRNHIEDDGADFDSREDILHDTSTRESMLETEEPGHDVPSKIRSRSSGVSDEGRSRPASDQHVFEDSARQRYTPKSKEPSTGRR